MNASGRRWERERERERDKGRKRIIMGVGEGEPYLSRVGSQVISHCVRLLLLRHAGEVGGCAGERGVCALEDGGCGDEMALLCGSFPSVVNRADKIFTSAEG